MGIECVNPDFTIFTANMGTHALSYLVIKTMITALEAMTKISYKTAIATTIFCLTKLLKLWLY